ncbi:MAG TPA: hypothetical protein VL856_18090 [Acidimicrobiia bacterium]|jgi:hypothetical protein|nr:hypothetical protein [Acidimicrobiia bacterium]
MSAAAPYTPPRVDLDIEWHVRPDEKQRGFVWVQRFRAGVQTDGDVPDCSNRLRIDASYRDHMALLAGEAALETALDEPRAEGPLGALSAHAGLVQDPRAIAARH